MNILKKLGLVLLISIITTGAFIQGEVQAAGKDKKLVIYTSRKEHLIKPVIEEYKKQTGEEVIYFTDKAGALIQRLKAEGSKSKADILITVDAGNLTFAKKEGLLAKTNSTVLNKNIPSSLRDPDNKWFGLSIRARTIAYNTNKVSPEELSTYEDLANPKWKGRLLLRTSKKVYNQSLVAMMIAHLGERQTLKTVKGWVKNFVMTPLSSDTKVLKSIAAGKGDVGIVNSYYFGRLIKKNPSLPLALYWPNQKDRGVHVNISGAGIIKSSKNKKSAVKFLEWLTSKNAQKIFADVNMEYPVRKDVRPSKIVLSWGEFKQDEMNIGKAGELQTTAIRLMDNAGYK